jgi:hypothetical protein
MLSGPDLSDHLVDKQQAITSARRSIRLETCENGLLVIERQNRQAW